MEYKTRMVSGKLQEFEIDHILNEMATQGWEFVNGFAYGQYTRQICLVFKKE